MNDFYFKRSLISLITFVALMGSSEIAHAMDHIDKDRVEGSHKTFLDLPVELLQRVGRKLDTRGALRLSQVSTSLQDAVTSEPDLRLVMRSPIRYVANTPYPELVSLNFTNFCQEHDRIIGHFYPNAADLEEKNDVMLNAFVLSRFLSTQQEVPSLLLAVQHLGADRNSITKTARFLIPDKCDFRKIRNILYMITDLGDKRLSICDALEDVSDFIDLHNPDQSDVPYTLFCFQLFGANLNHRIQLAKRYGFIYRKQKVDSVLRTLLVLDSLGEQSEAIYKVVSRFFKLENIPLDHRIYLSEDYRAHLIRFVKDLGESRESIITLTNKCGLLKGAMEEIIENITFIKELGDSRDEIFAAAQNLLTENMAASEIKRILKSSPVN